MGGVGWDAAELILGEIIMILVLGAAAQGKRAFARMYLMGGIAAEREVFWAPF